MFVPEKGETLAIFMVVLPCVLPRIAFKLIFYKVFLKVVKWNIEL